MFSLSVSPPKTGLCFQGFFDACLEIARRKFPSSSPSEMLERLITYCEEGLKGRSTAPPSEEESSESRRERLSPRMLRPQRRSVNLFPRRTITSLEEETVKDLYNNAMVRRQRSSSNDVNDFMRDMRHRTYIPSAFTTLSKGGGGGGSGGSQSEEE